MVDLRDLMRITYRNEQIRHSSLVLGPGLAVLDAAPLDVTERPVGDHGGEKEWVEPREGAGEAGDQAPVESEVEIASIVDLASLAIYRRTLA